MSNDDKRGSWGVPSKGEFETGDHEPLGRPGRRHWRQSVITEPGLNDRGDVFFAAVEMTRMPMILADPRQDDCPIVFANNAFLDLTGYEESEVLGRNCRFLQGARTDQEAVTQLRDAIASREAVALEILNYRRDGSPFWNAVFMGPVFDPAGELLYFFASQLDVSRRRESEDSLRQAQKMEAIGQLTAGLAHDFNNLIHVISGSLERLNEKLGDDAQPLRRYLDAAGQAADRGQKLTRQLLAFARRTRLEPKGVDLSELIASFGELLDSAVGQSARLILNLQRRLPSVRVDPTHLEMALLNVVVNARDASKDGGQITVSTREAKLDVDEAAAMQLEPGEYVELAVADQGVGMAPHIQARAIEPFFTTKGLGAGTGLGLAMAHGFVQQSGGRLQIESTPDVGTTIRMIFPRMSVDASDRSTPSAGYAARKLDPAARAPAILVVDDSPEVARLAEEALVDVGYRVVVASSADEAQRAFVAAREAGAPFSLVFTDVIMPGGDNGLVLSERLRALDPATPILLTTGYNDEMTQQAEGNAHLDVLGKPYCRSELIDRVQNALRRGARQGEPRQTSDFGVAEE